MALCVASHCLHEYYGMMMEDQQEDGEANVATWYIFYSDKENREYYYQPQTNTASWVLPKGARLSPNDDTDDTRECEDTETNEGSTPRESGPGFSDDNVIDLVECDETETSKSFSRRFLALVTTHRFGIALLLLNVFLSSSWIGSVLLSNNNAVVNNADISEAAATPSMTKIAVAAEQLILEQRLPTPECSAPVSVPPFEEKEPQSLFGDIFKKPIEAKEQVKEAAQVAASKGNEILQRIEGTVESAGYPIVTRYSNAKHQLIERITNVEPCQRPLSRLFSKECRQKHREQQLASADIAPGVRMQAAMDEGLHFMTAAGKNVVRFLSAPKAPWYPKVED
jgi:hypothetical protein